VDGDGNLDLIVAGNLYDTGPNSRAPTPATASGCAATAAGTSRRCPPPRADCSRRGM
jgi:hypothetical protein